PTSLVVLGASLYFAANDATFGSTVLWRSDGTEVGTVQIADVETYRELVPSGPYLYFTSNNDTELWRSDGTTAGTILLKTFVAVYPGIGYAGRLMFYGDDGVSGAELWQSDGSPAGTTLFAEFASGSAGSSP